jgi:hypothetical protein
VSTPYEQSGRIGQKQRTRRALIAAAIGGLYLTILVYSLVVRWPYNFTPTLKHYRFDTVGGYAPIWNSVYVAAWTAIVGTTLTFVGAYVVEKCRTAASGPLYLLSILPVSIPGMVLGLAYIFTFNAAGSVLAGSDLALFGRGGILLDARIAHDYGLGYPCSVRDASGGACGMAGFGAVFPGFEPGFVYATPSLRGAQISVGIYDPATIGNASLNRAPLPRVLSRRFRTAA